MNSFLQSRLLEPVVRQARRFSGASNSDTSDDAASAGRLSTSIDGPVSASVRQATVSSKSGDVAMTSGDDASASDPPDSVQDRSDPSLSVVIPLSTGGVVDAPVSDEGSAMRDPVVARQNGFQGLIPLDDVRSNYMFDSPPVQSPVEEPGRSSSTSFSRRSGTEARTLDSLSEMSLDDPPRMSTNPSLVASGPLRSQNESIYSNMSRSSGEGTQRGTNAPIVQLQEDTLRTGSPAMTGALPEDDGMRLLRAQLQQIHEMALSAEEKAKKMHELMVSDYMALQRTKGGNTDGYSNMDSHMSASVSGDGASHRSSSPGGSVLDAAELLIRPDDLRPTHRPRTPTADLSEHPHNGSSSDDEGDERPLGCKHYTRNIKVHCPDCRRWYTCRHCHDEDQTHTLNRRGITNMLCMQCGHPQRAGEYCTQCGKSTASYYCDICKLWDSDPRRKIYHCPDCGICRRGEGLGKDYIHCKKCNVCISIAWSLTHRCIEKATECGCPICSEYMFTSSASVVAMRCGHYIHRKCYDAYMQTSYKCPICNRSAVNMELQWRKLDRHIEGQPMPSQFTNTKAWVICNDCAARSCTKYHWLGNKCTVCDSYNTNELKLVNSPTQQEMAAMSDARAHRDRMVEESGVASLIPSPAERLQEPLVEAIVDLLHSDIDPMETEPGYTTMRHASDATVRQGSPPSIEQDFPVPLDSGTHHRPQFPSDDPLLIRYPPLIPSASDNPLRSDPYDMYSAPEGYRGLQEQAPSGTNSLRGDNDQDLDDDVEFWGEPVSPPLPSWSIPAMPTMPTMPTMSMPNMPAMPGMPSIPNMPTMPSMPYMRSMPSMPNMPRMPSIPDVHVGIPNGWAIPNMPTLAMPAIPAMPVSISPISQWSSPRFFAVRKSNSKDEDGARAENEHGDEAGDEEDSDDDMTWDGEGEGEEDDEDADVDEMELFGHR